MQLPTKQLLFYPYAACYYYDGAAPTTWGVAPIRQAAAAAMTGVLLAD